MLKKNNKVNILIFSCVFLSLSCVEDLTFKPRRHFIGNLKEDIISNPGIIHNEILTEYSINTNMFMTKMNIDTAIAIFINSTNKVMKRHNIHFRVDSQFIYINLNRFQAIKDECGFDFFGPGSNPELAFTYFKDIDEFNYKNIDKIIFLWKNIDIILNDLDAEDVLLLKDRNIKDPTVDIMLHSAYWWKQYYKNMDIFIESHPELKSWWDRWKKTIRELAFVAADCVGGLVGMPSGGASAIVGAALASIAFSLAWPPY